MTMMRRWRWWAVLAVITAVAVGPWAARRVDACGGIGPFAINCDGIIIANQITQIGHMVTQVSRMVDQLQSLNGVLDLTGELVESDDPEMGNIGRMRTMLDRQWEMSKGGIGLSTNGADVGAFLQRIPGVTDGANWLDAIAPQPTVLLGTRPGTVVSEPVPGTFDSWVVPDDGVSRDVLTALQAMGSGTASYRTVWDEMVADGSVPPLPTEAELEDLFDDADAAAMFIARRRRTEAMASASLIHTDAVSDSASSIAAQIGRASAALADLRKDDLLREQRLEQALVASHVANTELAIAQAQLAAYESAKAAREQYESERARRQRVAEWRESMDRGDQVWEEFREEINNEAADREAAYRYFPSSADWGW